MTDVTRDELLQKLFALSEEDRAAIVQTIIARFPNLDRDDLDEQARARLDSQLDDACLQADRGDTRPIEELLAKLRT